VVSVIIDECNFSIKVVEETSGKMIFSKGEDRTRMRAKQQGMAWDGNSVRESKHPPFFRQPPLYQGVGKV
ncbi:hypothetical protein Ancab_024989, partial [Ancistrocladus abbreviatus]